jgi:long-subunit fatty acid transport protein
MSIVLQSAKRLVMTFFVLPLSLFAQQEDTGNWLMYFGTNQVSDKFSVHTEIQYRNHTIAPVNIEQLLLRTGLNYHFSDKAFVSAGYAYIPSYVFESEQKSPETEEHRIWQQFILTNIIGRVKFEHRYRVEQRWVSNDFRNRFRYRLMLFVPLNKPKIEEGSLFLGLYDEIFVNTEEAFFDRNRLYGALGYQFSKTTSVQAGVLHQQVNDFGKWYVQFALVLNLDLRKTENK